MKKTTHLSSALFAILTLCFAGHASAQLSGFEKGPVIKDFGEHAAVPTHTISNDAKFSIAFDAVSGAEPGTVNRKFNSLARFINMHVASGVKKENIQLALIVHGGAIFDLLNNESFNKKYAVDNPNVALLKALLENNVRVILCGQSAAARGINSSELVNGVEIELSAMSAHALLQQNGYTLHPS
ncbi:DsrE family protein [Glaciecola sp. XM2]|uniref:DsrE family protein n=1 Tax=Glaciecola sp. XM2 TaxID=1914931 RepID=UPI001BDF2D4C|nr:DsrE family protein [Glaciecola sp. XM2]MBT1451472.1 DsrE family protein [Glaciecola sp. XM2]